MLFQCENSQSFEDRERNGINGCGSITAYPYFVCFILVVSVIFLNLFIAIILEGQLMATQQQEARVNEQTRDEFIRAWVKYDPDATGFIKVENMGELILDLALEEHQRKAEMLIKKKEYMFNFTTYPEISVLMKIRGQLPLTGVESYVRDSPSVKGQIDYQFQKFIASLALPLYKKLKYYNFYDTLNAFVNKLFERHHRLAFESREQRIEDAEALGKVDSLPFYDRIPVEGEEYWYLDIGE